MTTDTTSIPKLSYKNILLKRPLLFLIFILAIITVGLINFFSYRQVNNLISTNNWIIRTYQVIQDVNASLYNVTDFETHQRGYIIIGNYGNYSFLTDADIAKADLKLNLDNLYQLIKDDPEQTARVKNYVSWIDAMIGGLNKQIQLKQQNKIHTPEFTELFESNEDYSDQAVDSAREILSVELVLLDERNTLAIHSAETTSLFLIIGGTTSILVLLFAFMFITYELSISLNEENARANISNQLRSIIENANDMIAAMDKEYRFIFFNEVYRNEMKRLFGKSITIGMSLSDMLGDPSEEKNTVLELWKASLEGGKYEKVIEFNAGNEKITYEVTSSSITNARNEITSAVHIMRNISNRIRDQVKLKKTNEQLEFGMHALQEKNDQISTLIEMSDIILACNSQDELSVVISNYCERMFGFASGYLYLMHPSRNYLEVTSSWGEPITQDISFTPDQCWAIRLGRPHQVEDSHNGLICQHIKVTNQDNCSSLCMPLMAQNDIYGLLYIEIVSQEGPSFFSDNQKLLINAFSELIALALANVRLRENLRYQSIRDPLTGLYNRRYLEDFLFKQIQQSERAQSPLSVLMLDLDHFKKINDTFGHDAGDAVLKEVGIVLENDIRLGDFASRYGGEEFVIVFYNTDIEAAKRRAENIRQAIANLQIKYGAQPVGPITISIGISAYPENGKDMAALIEAADKSLYIAKNSGRNKIVLFPDIK